MSDNDIYNLIKDRNISNLHWSYYKYNDNDSENITISKLKILSSWYNLSIYYDIILYCILYSLLYLF